MSMNCVESDRFGTREMIPRAAAWRVYDIYTNLYRGDFGD